MERRVRTAQIDFSSQGRDRNEQRSKTSGTKMVRQENQGLSTRMVNSAMRAHLRRNKRMRGLL